jgi:hypothetical protein
MCGIHIGLYDHYVDIAKEEEKTNVCFEPPCMYYEKGRKSSVCFGPHVSIAIEEEKISMCFVNDMQVLHIIYLSNNKHIKRMGIASLVLVNFLCLWRHYGFIILSMYIKVKALKYCIRKQVDSK